MAPSLQARTQAHNLANRHDGRGFDARFHDIACSTSQRGLENPLMAGRRPADHGNRCLGKQATAHKLACNGIEMFERHVNHQRLTAGSQRMPVDAVWHIATGHMPGNEGDSMIGIAMSRWNTGIGKAANARCDARHDAERNTRSDQRQGFLATTPKDKGIAALQAQDTFAGARQGNQTVRNIRLFGRRFAAPLAGINQFRFRRCQGKNGVIDQRVINHDISLCERMMRKQGQQSRVAGTGSNQPDPTGLKHRKVRQTAMTW
jgi:hypothetical protein